MDTERNGSGDTARHLTVVIIPCDHDEAIWTSDLRNPDYRTFQGLVDGLIEHIDIAHGRHSFATSSRKSTVSR